MRTVTALVVVIVAVFLGLAGCSGGGSGGSVAGGGGGTPDTVSGIAAAGAVIAGTVYLKDSAATPKELTKAIAADGSYLFDVTGMTKPYLLKAVGTANGTSYTLYSMAADKGIANINPMTHLVVANAAAGADPAIIYSAPQAATIQAMAGKLTQAVADVQTSLNTLLQAHNIATVNPISDTYKADHNGLDGMLDKVKVDVKDGTVTITNANTGATIFTGQVSDIKGGTITTANIPQPTSTGPSAKIWTARSSGTTSTLNRVTYGGGQFVVVGDNGSILTSSDGITWTSRTSGTTISLNNITYAVGKFVAVGGNGFDSQIILTSSDGIAWTSRTSVTNSSGLKVPLLGITFGGGQFVAVGSDSYSNSIILTSNDGVVWTRRPINNYDGGIWRAVTYGGGMFVVVGHQGYLTPGSPVSTSIDGITWTEQPWVKTYSMLDIVYDGKQFVVSLGGDGAYMTSVDGKAWVSSNYLNYTSDISPIYGIGNSVYILERGQLSAHGTNEPGNSSMFITSTLLDVTSISFPPASRTYMNCIADGHGLLVAVGASGAIYSY